MKPPNSFDERHRTPARSLPVGTDGVLGGPPIRWVLADPRAARQGGADGTLSGDGVERDLVTLAASREADDLLHRVANLSEQAREIFFQRVRSLAQALEDRDPWSRGHSEHVTCYALGIAQMLGLDTPEVDVIGRAAQVHDVGKIGVPDGILGEARPLTHEERRLVQQHSLIGVHLLDQAQCIGREVPLVRHHHEHWDGTGYPDGIGGDRIPPGARVLAVADTFDAVTSPRAYRPSRTIAQAVRVLREESGRQFDPDVVDAMLTWVERIGHRTGKAGHLAPEDLLNEPAAACSA